MDADITNAISLLKANGYDVFEAIPVIEEMNDQTLLMWKTKITAWGTDICHTQIDYATRIRLELDRREIP